VTKPPKSPSAATTTLRRADASVMQAPVVAIIATEAAHEG